MVVEFRAEGRVKSKHILLERGNEEESIRLLPVVPCNRTRGKGQKVKQRKRIFL